MASANPFAVLALVDQEEDTCHPPGVWSDDKTEPEPQEKKSETLTPLERFVHEQLRAHPRLGVTASAMAREILCMHPSDRQALGLSPELRSREIRQALGDRILYNRESALELVAAGHNPRYWFLKTPPH